MTKVMAKKAPNNNGHRQRLKDRFLKNGLQGFHDYEVIELLLTLNTPRKDCKQSAKALLNRYKTFQSVMEASIPDLCDVKGVGPANSFGIKLIKAVADRYLESRILSRDVVQNPDDLKSFLKHTIGFKSRELFAGIFLDAKNRVIASEVLFEGTLTTSSVYPREVIIRALGHNAAAMIVAHNHPSGDVNPSQSDINITRTLFMALRFAGINLHEHMIIGENSSYSFAAQGLVQQFSEEFKSIR
jgi:DNA repair protein RadC